MTKLQIAALLSNIKNEDFDRYNSVDTIVNNDIMMNMPIFWSEDANGNTNIDIESMRIMFEQVLNAAEKYNDESNFDFDNF
jgi:hypothetical protein